MQTSDNSSPPLAYRMASWAGIAPLVGLALATWIATAAGNTSDFAFFTIAYAAAVLAFMGGSRWGYALKLHDGKRDIRRLLRAMTPPLVAWAAIVTPPLAGTAILLAAFLVQAVWDVTSAQSGHLPSWAARVRVEIAGFAVLALLIVLAEQIFIPG